MTSWIAAGVALLQLLAALLDIARRERSESTGAALALKKVADDALSDIQAAHAARLAQRARDAAGGLHDDTDPYRRD